MKRNTEWLMLDWISYMIVHSFRAKFFTLHVNLYSICHKKCREKIFPCRKESFHCLPRLDLQICMSLQLLMILLRISIGCTLVPAVVIMLEQYYYYDMFTFFGKTWLKKRHCKVIFIPIQLESNGKSLFTACSVKLPKLSHIYEKTSQSMQRRAWGLHIW